MISPNNDGLEDFIAFLGDQCGPLLETARIYAQELLAARARIAELIGGLNTACLQRDAKLCSECPRGRAVKGLIEACADTGFNADDENDVHPITLALRELAILRRLGGQTT